MKRNTVGLDLAKEVFQVHEVDEVTGEIIRKKLKKKEMTEYFANKANVTVAMEACGSAHHWAREMKKLGHEVKLITPYFVKPYVKSNKTDQADAEAIWTAAQQPGMRYVGVKTQEQQAVLTLHRVRQQLVKVRTMQTNQIRGILYEFGVGLPVGRVKAMKELQMMTVEAEGRVPDVILTALQDQMERVKRLSEDIDKIELQLAQWKKGDEKTQRLARIPGVGLLTASALAVMLGDAKAFKNGREFAAFLGLVPRQSGTGGKVRLLGISKRGDKYLRTLLVHGARVVLFRGKKPNAWLEKLKERRHVNVAAVALANKMARTAWALIAKGTEYRTA